MGAYTCEFGVVHKVCRCPTPHTVKCDVPSEHEAQAAVPVAPCDRVVFDTLGKHEKHEVHKYWKAPQFRKATSEYLCPGRD